MMTPDWEPLITTSRVTLRRFVEDDAPRLYVMSQETGLRTWLPDQVYGSLDEALEVARFLIQKFRDPGNPAVAPVVLGVCQRARESSSDTSD